VVGLPSFAGYAVDHT